MERLTLTPRNDWRRRAEEIGFSFHTIGGKPYWDETAAYLFTAAEIDAIEEATAELERLCIAAVDKVVKENLFAPFGLSEAAAKLARDSWARGDRNLYGRFDLRVAPGEPPKLYEYNADTPTALFEASVVQWEWLETLYPGDDQFNSIHEKLIAAWPQLRLPGGTLHLTCVRDHDEDRGTVDYLRDTAMQAGLDTQFLFIDEIGWNGLAFTDLEDRQIQALFKLYPWEWLMAEEFAQSIGPSGLRVIEPAWKMVLSNKAILSLLWHMFPDHPNLLPAYLEPGKIAGPAVAKPLLGREGEDIRRVSGTEKGKPGEYGAEGFVYQALAPLPDFGGRHPVVGSWVVASQPAGIGIREDDDPITRNTSRFVPHLFR